MKLYWIGAVAIAAAAGCSTAAHVEKADDADLSGAKTYQWVDTRASENDNSSRTVAYADIGIHNAVNQELRKWGWTESDQQPSVLVAYDVLVEKSVERRQEPVYSQPYTRYYYNYRLKRYTPFYFPSQFVGYDNYTVPVKEATVTVTLIDAEKDKKIWQGWTTQRLSESSRLTEDDIREAVQSIFREGNKGR